MLFTSAKIGHLGFLPQGQPERLDRALSMVQVHDDEGFGNCTNHGACQNACPKGISVDFIARLNRDLVRATLTQKPYEIKAV
jgi:succinate dehydrogenase / fumarate reductase iron-sulfur subunit